MKQYKKFRYTAAFIVTLILVAMLIVVLQDDTNYIDESIDTQAYKSVNCNDINTEVKTMTIQLDTNTNNSESIPVDWYESVKIYSST